MQLVLKAHACFVLKDRIISKHQQISEVYPDIKLDIFSFSIAFGTFVDKFSAKH